VFIVNVLWLEVNTCCNEIGVIAQRSLFINHKSYDYLSPGGRELERGKFTLTQPLSLQGRGFYTNCAEDYNVVAKNRG
jgi:hypothetical protein